MMICSYVDTIVWLLRFIRRLGVQFPISRSERLIHAPLVYLVGKNLGRQNVTTTSTAQ